MKDAHLYILERDPGGRDEESNIAAGGERK